MKYTFTLEDPENNEYGPAREIKHVITGEQTWPELLEHFEHWLKGCGFMFNGHIEMVDDQEPYRDV